MLQAAVVAAVREEVHAALHRTPTMESVAEDLGFVLGTLPPEEALAFAATVIKPIADFIENSTPAEPEDDTTGAEGTGETEE